MVMVVVDQLRADYLKTFERHWRSGFVRCSTAEWSTRTRGIPISEPSPAPATRRLERARCPTRTAWSTTAGGARGPPASSAATADPASPDISYGRPMRLGNSAVHLMVPTLRRRTARAEARRARRGAVDESAQRDRSRRPRWRRGRVVRRSVRVVGDVARVCRRTGASGQSVHRQEPVQKGSGPRVGALGTRVQLRHARCRGRRTATARMERPVPASDQGTGRCGRAVLRAVAGDAAGRHLSRRLADAMLDSFKLGTRKTTDFLGISFSVLDDVGHSFGPDSREVEEVLRQLDVTLGDAHRAARFAGRA